MEPERGSGWFGLPSMIGLVVAVTVASAVHGVVGLIAAAVGVLVVLLVIGFAMSVANKG
jgi:hypothetical protein